LSLERTTARTQPLASSPAAAPAEPGAFYRPELDGLRFFAFLAVYVNHTFLFGSVGHHRHMPDSLANALGDVGVAGAFGVDLFFVLSAYLITELLLRERRARGTLDVKAFYLRRILRIWPLYFLFLVFARALAAFVPGERFDWNHLLAFALFSGNWIWILRPVDTVAAPLWSVSIEEQFYICWPLVVRRGTVRRVVIAAVAILAVGAAVRLALSLHGVDEEWISRNSLTRVDGIAAGVLLAAALRGRLPRLAAGARLALLGGGLAALLVVARWFNPIANPVRPLSATLGCPLVALACCAILVSALGAEGAPFRLLRARPLVYLGRISYGLYVFHQVGLLVATRLFPRHAQAVGPWVGHLAVGLAVTVGLAALSYRFIEQPFLRLKQRFTVVRSRPDIAAV
jgi:peptidoglycan/LPS O-acetylase OafA/YrhL